MSHSSFSASERRGIIAIAVIALLLVLGGLGVSFCTSTHEAADEFPVVENHPEMVDSAALIKKEKDSRKKVKKESSAKSKSKKNYRRRSPLDETVKKHEQ